MLRVRLDDDLTFVGEDTGERSLLLIEPDGFTGWDDGTDIRREETVIPVGHGSFDAPGYLTPRVPAITGQILTDSPRSFQHMRLRLTGALATGTTGKLVVDQDMGTQWATVRLAAKTQVRVNSADLTSGRFQIQFWTGDPRKYGDEHVFGPSTAPIAYHYGNFPASPVLEVTGTMPSGYTVSAGGSSFVVSQALTSGQTHRIDLRTGRLYRNGVLQLNAVTQASLWSIPPGAKYTHTLTPVSGSGQLTVTVLDTYS